MYQLGEEITPTLRTPEPAIGSELKVGDITETIVAQKCVLKDLWGIGFDPNVPIDPELLSGIERGYVEGMWTKIVSEGHTPLFIRGWITDATYANHYSPRIDGVVWIQCIWKCEHSSPFAISITVSWAVTILAAIIVLYLTSPYWGPIFWRWAGYEPGEVPPAPSPAPGLELVVYAVIAIVIGAGVIVVAPKVIDLVTAYR